jgi:hypothetical protein
MLLAALSPSANPLALTDPWIRNKAVVADQASTLTSRGAHPPVFACDRLVLDFSAHQPTHCPKGWPASAEQDRPTSGKRLSLLRKCAVESVIRTSLKC